MAENQYDFPTEVLDLPSKGLLYPKDSPLSSGQIDIKYMTAKEEDILTSTNLLEKGLAIDKLLESIIADSKITSYIAALSLRPPRVWFGLNKTSMWRLLFLNKSEDKLFDFLL